MPGIDPAAASIETPSALQLGRDVFGSMEETLRREWLVTNGIGGYAAGTIGGANSRRYHGLLVAALRPPVERTVMVAKADALVRYAGRQTPISTNEFVDGTVHPAGYRHLESFRLEGSLPVWTWVIGDALLEQRIWMAHGENTTYLAFHLQRASDSIEIELQPLCTYREFHHHHRGRGDATVHAVDRGFEVIAYPGARRYRVLLEGGDYRLAPDWFWNFKHREEAARGLDDLEDLFRPAVITIRLAPQGSAAILLTTESRPPPTALQSWAQEHERQRGLLSHARLDVPAQAPTSRDALRPLIRQLVLAADQFIVERRDQAGKPLGHSVIAGYPWFSDWGRDTMIALPGLAIATGREDIAASILRTFARYLSEGMLPNVFPDSGATPEYNTVDATLWYFAAVDAYLRRVRKPTLGRELYPALKDIVAWHLRGTRFGIRVDPRDGLLMAGQAGVQLTWMDAKCGDWVVTPRIGKCVEINALWINALNVMGRLAADMGEAAAQREYTQLFERAARSFNDKFWYAAGAYLYDVIDGPEGDPHGIGGARDASLRPNQIFAVSLPCMVLEGDRARAVVDVCARELWTPVGLRSLGPLDPRFSGSYRGGPHERDGAYHQGTVWSWLLGPFVTAHHRVYGDAVCARSYLDGIAAHLREACIGQVSEIFEGEAPFAPRGCFAQAWSVAEILRAWCELDER